MPYVGKNQRVMTHQIQRKENDQKMLVPRSRVRNPFFTCDQINAKRNDAHREQAID